MLAFGIGLLATAAVLRRRSWLAVALVAVAAVVHVTTAMWFAVLLGVALAILDRQMRALAVAAAVAAAVAGLWALATGRLDASLAPMDDVWLQAVATKDSLFADRMAGLGVGRRTSRSSGCSGGRIAAGSATASRRAEDAALAWGATALVAVFLLTLPLVAAGASLPVQLQISRVFWLVDFVALVYVLAIVAEPSSRTVEVSATSAHCSCGFRLQRGRPDGPVQLRAQVVAAVLIAVRRRRAARTSCSSSAPSGRCSPCTRRNPPGRTRCAGSHASRRTRTSWPIPVTRGSTAPASARPACTTCSSRKSRTRRSRSIRATWRRASSSEPRRSATSAR